MADWVILGCGYVGTRLARALLAEGRRVRVCGRNLEKLEPLRALGAQVHAIDASKLRTFGPALYGTRSPMVVYSIPPVPNMPPGEPLRRAAEAAVGVGAQKFIYLSSTAVYGETEHGVTVDEDSPISIGDSEAGPRIAEESAVEGARLAGLSTVVLRLSAIYGPGRGVRERLKAQSYKLTDDGMHFFSRVHVDDLVGIIRAAADRAPTGALYCVADDRPSTQREYAEWLCARMGLPLPPSVPSLAPGKPRRAVRNRKVSNARLKRELAYTFRHPSFVEGELAIEAETAEAATPSATPVSGSAPAAAPIAPAPEPPSVAAAPAPPAAPEDSLAPRLAKVEALWLEALALALGEATQHAEANRLPAARESLAHAASIDELLARQRALFPALPPVPDAQVRALLPRLREAIERARGRHPEGVADLDATLQKLVKGRG